MFNVRPKPDGRQGESGKSGPGLIRSQFNFQPARSTLCVTYKSIGTSHPTMKLSDGCIKLWGFVFFSRYGEARWSFQPGRRTVRICIRADWDLVARTTMEFVKIEPINVHKTPKSSCKHFWWDSTRKRFFKFLFTNHLIGRAEHKWMSDFSDFNFFKKKKTYIHPLSSRTRSDKTRIPSPRHLDQFLQGNPNVSPVQSRSIVLSFVSLKMLQAIYYFSSLSLFMVMNYFLLLYHIK